MKKATWITLFKLAIVAWICTFTYLGVSGAAKNAAFADSCEAKGGQIVTTRGEQGQVVCAKLEILNDVRR